MDTRASLNPTDSELEAIARLYGFEEFNVLLGIIARRAESHNQELIYAPAGASVELARGRTQEASEILRLVNHAATRLEKRRSAKPG